MDHGPGPWGGPWTPVHVLYTSSLKGQQTSKPLFVYALPGVALVSVFRFVKY